MLFGRWAALAGVIVVAVLLQTTAAQDPKNADPKNAAPSLPPSGTEVEYLDARGALKKGKFVDVAPNGAVRVRIEDGSTRLMPPNRVRLPQGAANAAPSVAIPAGVKPTENEPVPATVHPPAENPSPKRTWTDASGVHKIEAEFVGLQDGKVQLKKTADGKVISLPLEKLAAADQAIAKALVSSVTPSTPQGAPLPSNSVPSSTVPEGVTGAAAAADFLNATKVSPFTPSIWQGVPDPGPMLAADLGVAFRPPRFGQLVLGTEEATQALVLNRKKQQAWIGIAGTHSDMRNTYVFARMNLATGEALPRLAAAHALQPLDFDPSGEQLVALNLKESPLDKHVLDVYNVKDEHLTLVKSFIPFADPRNPGSASSVRKAAFVDATHLLLVSSSNLLVLWDLPAAKPVYTLQGGVGAVQFCLSPGKRHVAVATEHGVYLLDALTGQNLGKFDQGLDRSADQMFGGLAFNDDGSLLVAVKPQGIWVWKTQDGQIHKSHEGLALRTAPGMAVAFSSVPGHVVFGENWAFDYEHGVMTSQNSGKSPKGLETFAGKHWWIDTWVDAETANYAHGLLQYELPTAEALEKLKATSDDELLAIKPGARIALALPPQSDAKSTEAIRAGLSETFREKGWTLTAAGEAGDFTLTCAALPLPQVEILYRSSGAVPRVEKTRRDYFRGHMKLTRTGETKPIWEHVILWGPPRFFQLQEGQALDDALRYPPFTEYFARPAIPQRLPKYPRESISIQLLTHEKGSFLNIP